MPQNRYTTPPWKPSLTNNFRAPARLPKGEREEGRKDRPEVSALQCADYGSGEKGNEGGKWNVLGERRDSQAYPYLFRHSIIYSNMTQGIMV